MTIEASARTRVFVVGMGAVTPFGSSVEALWQGARNGEVAIRRLRRDMSRYGSDLGGEVVDAPRPLHGYRRPRGHREPAIDFALVAAEEAVAAAGDAIAAIPQDRWGVVAATCNAGIVSAEAWQRAAAAGLATRPSLALLTTPQAIAEAIGGAFGLRGPVVSLNTACAAGANAIGYAADLIRSGDADAVLAGGSDALSPIVFAGFTSLESLAPEPAAPYSKDRRGLSLGEGAGIVLLVSGETVERLGLRPQGEILGYGLSSDGYHPTAPHPEGAGAGRAIAAALQIAGVEPGDVGYVNGHGTGTPKNDVAETLAIRRGLGAAADGVPVSSTKSMIGHLLGAAGAVEAIVTIRALQERFAPPTANFGEADPECDLDYVPNVGRAFSRDVAISNNFAFGGANACLVLGRPERAAQGRPDAALERIVITGLATLTPLACRPHVLRAAIERGDRPRLSGEDPVARVDIEPTPYLSQRERRRMDQMSILAILAAKLALADAGWRVSDDNAGRIGLVFGTGIGPMESMTSFAGPVLDEGAAVANPAIFPSVVYNAAAGLVTIHTGILGPTSTVTAGSAASGVALSYAYDLLRTGRADAILCLAVDSATAGVADAFRDAGMGRGSGYVLSEGAAAILLERESVARERGARPRAEVLGYAMAADGRGIGRWDPRGGAVERSLTGALARAGRRTSDVRTIWTGACGVPAADRAESSALGRLFPGETLRSNPGLAIGDTIGVGAGLAVALSVVDRDSRGIDDRTVDIVRSSALGGTQVSIAIGSLPAARTS